MENNIERKIYNLRTKLNKMVSEDISLTDDRVVKLSAKLDKLLNAFLHSKNN